MEDGLGLLDPEASKTDIAGSVESEKLKTQPAGSEPKASASESLSCANSKQSRGLAKDTNEKSSAASRTAEPASLCGASQSPNTKSASRIGSKTPADSMSRDGDAEGSKGFAKPTEIIFLKGKNNSIKHGAQPSKQAGKSKKQKESKNDLVEEDAENSNRHGNQKSRSTKQQKGGKTKSRRGKGKEKKQKATTLFGSLEPESNSEPKKQKFKRKKAKLSQSLF